MEHRLAGLTSVSRIRGFYLSKDCGGWRARIGCGLQSMYGSRNPCMGEGEDEQKAGKAEILAVVAARVSNTPSNDLANIAAYHSNKVWESLV